MTLRHLQCFVAVCDCGGATRAADLLHVTQPAISRTITELEQYYGVQLFERKQRKMIPTETGKVLLQKAREVCEQFERFEALAKSAEFVGIRIGASLTVGKLQMPALLRTLRHTYPTVRCSLKVDKTSAVAQAVLSGELDLAIVEGGVTPQLRAYPFAEDVLVAVCAKEYPAPASLAAEAFARESLLLREPGSGSRDLIDGIFAARGIELVPAVESVSNEALLSAAEAGLGIAVLPAALVGEGLQAGTLRAVRVADTDLHRVISLIVHPNKSFSPSQRGVFEFFLHAGSAQAEV